MFKDKVEYVDRVLSHRLGMTPLCYEVSEKIETRVKNTRQASLLTEKLNCNMRTPGNIQVV